MTLDTGTKIENNSAYEREICSFSRKDMLLNVLLFSLLAVCLGLMVWILFW